MLQVAKARARRSPDLTALIFFMIFLFEAVPRSIVHRYFLQVLVALCLPKMPGRSPPTLRIRSRIGPPGLGKKKPLKGVPNYWPTCVRYSVFFCSCWRLRSVRGASKTRRRIGFSFGVVAAYTCCMFCERKFSANTILRLSKMSVHAELPRDSQFY